MSYNVLILGESGTGKSTSARNLPSEETFYINVIGKPLPFPKAKYRYQKLSGDGDSGNYYVTDQSHMILRLLNLINKKRSDIKYIIIDDFGYTFSNTYMRRAHEKGYERFNDIGKDAFNVISTLSNLRDDLFCFVMMHTDIDANNRLKPKTVGKVIDDKVCIEGYFTYVLHSMIIDYQYKYLTNNDGQHMAKTPLGLFDEQFIDNDLLLVVNAIKEFE